MRRLSAVLLPCLLMVGCDPSLDDNDRGGHDGAVSIDGMIDATPIPPIPNPTVGLEQIQVKGNHRSDWLPAANVEPELQPDSYRGILRSSLALQMTLEDARVYHFGFHFVYQDYRGGARPGYYWGPDESMCSFFPECFAGVLRDLPRTGWVGPIFVLFEHFPAPLFEIEEAHTYTEGELERYGYPYETYIYELEMATEFLPRERIFAPNDLRGDHPTLRDAIREDGWPSVEELDGKFIFVMIERGELRDVYLEQQWRPRYFYEPGDPRAFVVADSPDDDHAAFFSFIGPESVDSAAALVEQGFMVHGGAEDGVTIRRYEDVGAQLLTSQHAEQVNFEGPGRCNPVTAEPRCWEAYEPPPDPEGVAPGEP